MGEFGTLVSSSSGLTILGGILVVLIGIAVCGWAGLSKEREMPKEVKQKYIKDFNFRKGLIVAIFSGIMSACFAFAVHAGKPIAELARQYNTPVLWQNSVVLVLIMGGGFFTNAGTCLVMNARNKTFGNYFSASGSPLISVRKTARSLRVSFN